jgi:hypothetical protein
MLSHGGFTGGHSAENIRICSGRTEQEGNDRSRDSDYRAEGEKKRSLSVEVSKKSTSKTVAVRKIFFNDVAFQGETQVVFAAHYIHKERCSAS